MRTSVEVSFKFDEAIQHPMRGTAIWVVRVASRTIDPAGIIHEAA